MIWPQTLVPNRYQIHSRTSGPDRELKNPWSTAINWAPKTGPNSPQLVQNRKRATPYPISISMTCTHPYPTPISLLGD